MPSFFNNASESFSFNGTAIAERLEPTEILNISSLCRLLHQKYGEARSKLLAEVMLEKSRLLKFSQNILPGRTSASLRFNEAVDPVFFNRIKASTDPNLLGAVLWILNGACNTLEKHGSPTTTLLQDSKRARKDIMSSLCAQTGIIGYHQVICSVVMQNKVDYYDANGNPDKSSFTPTPGDMDIFLRALYCLKLLVELGSDTLKAPLTDALKKNAETNSSATSSQSYSASDDEDTSDGISFSVLGQHLDNLFTLNDNDELAVNIVEFTTLKRLVLDEVSTEHLQKMECRNLKAYDRQIEKSAKEEVASLGLLNIPSPELTT